MSERRIPVSVFALFAQPVICVRKDCISYMNARAIALAGKDLVGKPANTLLSSQLLSDPEGSFVAAAFVGTKSCVINAGAYAGEQVFVLCPDEAPRQTEAAVFAGMRSSLATLRICGSRISRLAELRCDDTLRSYAVSVNRCYYKMKRNIDNLSLIDLIRCGEYPFFAESTDLTELFSKLIDSVNVLLGTATKIEFSAPPELYAVVDRYLAELALLNLLSNSLAHCGENDRISVSLVRTDKSTVLAVNDSGSGIAPEELPHVFDRQSRCSDLSAAAEGVGLGLATVRSIAELHGGTVLLESRGVGCGTSVRLMLSNFVAASGRLRSDTMLYGSVGLTSILQELSDALPDDCFSSMTDD